MHYIEEQNYQNRFVALFDVLGFSNLVKNKGVKYLAERFEIIFNKNEKWGHPNWDLHGYDFFSTRAEYILFSDTIVLLSYPDLPPSDFYLICNQLISFSLEQDIPLRGGLAYGNIYYNKEKSILIGQPMVDAYLLEESQEWIGCAFHKSCIAGDNMLSHYRTLTVDYCRYEIPLKNNLVQNHLNIALDGWIHINAYKIVRRLSEDAPSKVINKYENTLVFINSMRDINKKLKTTLELERKENNA